MSTSLYIAPAAAGKTAYLVDETRHLAQELKITPRVIVPSRLQIQSWRRRLSQAGGALGIQVGTFDDLYREILSQSGQVVTHLTDPVQFRLLRTLLDQAPLTYYASLRAAPGFVQTVRDLIRELKAGGVSPEQVTAAVEAMGSQPRLLELAQLYTAYQERLQQEGWADYAGIAWLAAETLQHKPALGADWSPLLVDGFDDLTTVQLAVLEQLADRVDNLIVTLTGTWDGSDRELVHKRFNRTRIDLEEALGVEAEPLPARPVGGSPAPPLAHLESTLFSANSAQQPADEVVTLIAAPDREAEVRTALRWLKKRIVRDRMEPGDVALLFRASEPYRPFIVQTAEEFGLPIHIVDGLPLQSNPAVAAVISLLRLSLPGDTCLAWRETVEAWRSPYFDWIETSLEITMKDADALDWVARWGNVISGREHWQETFELLSTAAGETAERREDQQEMLATLPSGEDADQLRQLFQRFVARIRPPEGQQPCRVFVSWLEDLIGSIGRDDGEDAATLDDSLGIARRAADSPRSLAERDLAALNTLKDILRGLVWAEEAVACPPQPFGAFLADLESAVDAATYRPPLPSDEEAIMVADVTQARGLPFLAVALLGLGEGEFPRTLTADPFLRETDRIRLRDDFSLAIDLSTDSAETEYFYEAITRPREALLLTRSRIADDGAPWQSSSYWEEVRRRLDVTPQRLTSEHRPTLKEAASWPEVAQTLGASSQDDAAWAWAADHQAKLCGAIERASAILAQRAKKVVDDQILKTAGAYDGDLTPWADTFAQVFAPQQTWSASRLEAYRTCPFFFFVGRVLGLEMRQRPVEGLDARQLGNIYHRILEKLYETVGTDADLQSLQETLPDISGQVLDDAPRREQFRATAWWERTRHAIVEHVARSLEALEAQEDGFTFYRAEQAFGISGEPGPALVIRDGGDAFRLCGYIDRIDRAEGDQIRIIDYKTASPSSYRDQALREGKKLQLPLYALAAQEPLRLGQVVEGFYWHVQHAQPSHVTLGAFGPEAAIETAVAHAWTAVRGARRGEFGPQAPDDDCPAYCPAASFCWHFSPRQW